MTENAEANATLFWSTTIRLTADENSPDDAAYVAQRLQEMHQRAASLVVSGWTLQASHTYTTSDGATWLYMFMTV